MTVASVPVTSRCWCCHAWVTSWRPAGLRERPVQCPDCLVEWLPTPDETAAEVGG